MYVYMYNLCVLVRLYVRAQACVHARAYVNECACVCVYACVLARHSCTSAHPKNPSSRQRTCQRGDIAVMPRPHISRDSWWPAHPPRARRHGYRNCICMIKNLSRQGNLLCYVEGRGERGRGEGGRGGRSGMGRGGEGGKGCYGWEAGESVMYVFFFNFFPLFLSFYPNFFS